MRDVIAAFILAKMYGVMLLCIQGAGTSCAHVVRNALVAEIT